MEKFSAQQFDLPSLLGARLCHDLISPVGAIRNGLELLEIANSNNGPEKELVFSSASSADARLRFFRIVFGTASDEQSLKASDVRRLLSDYLTGSTLSVDWALEHSLPRNLVKAILLTVMCCETSIARNGNITVQMVEDVVVLSAVSSRKIIGKDHLEGLKSGQWDEDLSASHVHFPLAWLAAEATKYSYAVWETLEGLRIQLAPSPALVSVPSIADRTIANDKILEAG